MKRITMLYFPLRVTHVLALTLTMLIVVGASKRPVFAQPKLSDSLAVREGRQDWMQADFALDNSGYAATRKQIDKLVRGGTNPTLLKQKYRLRGSEVNDPQKIFRWAYAAYRENKIKPDQNFLSDVSAALDRNRRPGAYDWVRLRFLVASLQTFLRPTTQLIEVGRRLLKVRYDDEEVMFHFVRSLHDSESLAERKQAVALSRETAQKFPKDVYWQWMVADCVSSVTDYGWRFTHEQNEETIAEYKKTLQLLPAGHPYRRRLVEEIVRLDLRFDDKGNRVKWTRQKYREALQNTNLK